MTGALVIAAAQPACISHDVDANAVAHADAVRRADARVVVFPELSLTGYELDTPVVPLDHPALARIVDACDTCGSVAFVGAPVHDDDGDHIAVLRIGAGGVEVAYRKQWLCEEEAVRFTPGDRCSLVDVDGWRLGLAICKDTGIPEHAAEAASLGMDVYVAGVLDDVDDAPIQHERARRITVEHGVWMVVASFAGSTGGGYDRTAADSRIWSPSGELLASAGPDPGRIARAMILPSKAGAAISPTG